MGSELLLHQVYYSFKSVVKRPPLPRYSHSGSNVGLGYCLNLAVCNWKPASWTKPAPRLLGHVCMVNGAEAVDFVCS